MFVHINIYHWRFISDDRTYATGVIIAVSRTVVVQLHCYFEINSTEWIY